MRRYLVRRLLHAFIVIWGAATLVFLILHLAPGDPVVNLVGENATEEQFALVRKSLGLDRPLHQRYLTYMADLARGDLGKSWFVGQSTVDMLHSVVSADATVDGSCSRTAARCTLKPCQKLSWWTNASLRLGSSFAAVNPRIA